MWGAQENQPGAASLSALPRPRRVLSAHAPVCEPAAQIPLSAGPTLLPAARPRRPLRAHPTRGSPGPGEDHPSAPHRSPCPISGPPKPLTQGLPSGSVPRAGPQPDPGSRRPSGTCTLSSEYRNSTSWKKKSNNIASVWKVWE